jgi:hypothetical protein
VRLPRSPLPAIVEFRNALGWRCHRLARKGLFALTIAIHAIGVVAMAIAGFGIRTRLETRKLGSWHLIPIVIVSV